MTASKGMRISQFSALTGGARTPSIRLLMIERFVACACQCRQNQKSVAAHFKTRPIFVTPQCSTGPNPEQAISCADRETSRKCGAHKQNRERQRETVKEGSSHGRSKRIRRDAPERRGLPCQA